MGALAPLWARKGGPDSKAHLHLHDPDLVRVLPGHAQAMCGTDAAHGQYEQWQVDDHAARCSRCLTALEVFVEQAQKAPEPLVTEQVMVTVVRKAVDAAREPLDQVVGRDLAKHKSWSISVAPMGGA